MGLGGNGAVVGLYGKGCVEAYGSELELEFPRGKGVYLKCTGTKAPSPHQLPFGHL